MPRVGLILGRAILAGAARAQTAPGAQERADPDFGLSRPSAAPRQQRRRSPPRETCRHSTPPARRRRSAGAIAHLNGAPYEGEAEIILSGRDKCRMAWRTGSSSVQRGVCMRSGYVFMAAYQFRNGTVGLITYEVQPDGALKGMWTIADTDGRGTEVLTPLR